MQSEKSLSEYFLMHYVSRFLYPQLFVNQTSGCVVTDKTTGNKHVCAEIRTYKDRKSYVVRIFQNGFETIDHVIFGTGGTSQIYLFDSTLNKFAELTTAIDRRRHSRCTELRITSTTSLQRLAQCLQQKGIKNRKRALLGIVTYCESWVVVDLSDVSHIQVAKISSEGNAAPQLGYAEMLTKCQIQSIHDSKVWLTNQVIQFDVCQLVVHSFCISYLPNALSDLWRLITTNRFASDTLAGLLERELVDLIHRWIFWYLWGHNHEFLSDILLGLSMPPVLVEQVKEYFALFTAQELQALHRQLLPLQMGNSVVF